ncbi:MAG: hypothetical protein A2Z04_07680 [Chloroflexi bacterium RBG_16_57_9]|nr:MAG: hypothetical protein A2Z04_07680 [Chloroflexi bacterium RBG_16_57_9]
MGTASAIRSQGWGDMGVQSNGSGVEAMMNGWGNMLGRIGGMMNGQGNGYNNSAGGMMNGGGVMGGQGNGYNGSGGMMGGSGMMGGR